MIEGKKLERTPKINNFKGKGFYITGMFLLVARVGRSMLIKNVQLGER
ncbi:MAG: hypothetical protein ACFFCS_14610 [Candidatus Hodarchaeota archaeon]